MRADNIIDVEIKIAISQLKPTKWTGEPSQEAETELVEVREFKKLTPLQATKKLLDYIHEY